MEALELSDESAIDSMNEENETDLSDESVDDEPEKEFEYRLRQVRTDIRKLRDKYPDITELSRSNRHLYLRLLENERHLAIYIEDTKKATQLQILAALSARPPEKKNGSLFYGDKMFEICGTVTHAYLEELISSPFHHLEKYGCKKWQVLPRESEYYLFRNSVYRISKEVKIPPKMPWYFKHQSLADILTFLFAAVVVFILFVIYLYVTSLFNFNQK